MLLEMDAKHTIMLPKNDEEDEDTNKVNFHSNRKVIIFKMMKKMKIIIWLVFILIER